MLPYVALCFFTAVQAFNTINDLESGNFKDWINHTQFKQMILNKLMDEPDPNVMYLKMFDASTKLPNGALFGGSFFDLGNFDECYDIRGVNNTYGKYCLGNLPLSNNPLMHPLRAAILPKLRMVAGSSSMGYYWAFCVPSTLSVETLNKNGIIKFQDVLCYSKDTEPSLTTGAALTIATIASFLGVSLVSTVYDLFLFYTEKKAHYKMLIAFSYLSNGRRLIESNNNPDHLLCLNGIRAISMMWVILSHLYSLAPFAPWSNFLDVMDWMGNSTNMIINGASVSVDTFFAVGGLVTAYTFLNTVNKGHHFNIFNYYLHRFLRLTPAFGVAILVYYNLLPYLGNGPLWYSTVQTLSEGCADTWWHSILYFSNYMEEATCVPQAWYLQVDMQLFILSPLVLIPLVKWRKWAYVELGILTAAGIVVPFCLGYFNNVKAPGLDMSDMFKYYAVTHARFGPYVIGLITGLLIYNLKNGYVSKTMNMWIVWTLWIGTIAVLIACVYAGYNFCALEKTPVMDDVWANSFFLGFNRNGWAFAVCIVIYLCVSEYGGPVNYLLTIPIFQFISKLSYSTYLVHYAVIHMSYTSSRHAFKLSNGAIFKHFWGHFMVTLAVSVFLCLTFESPIIIIEKWIFGGKRSFKTTEKVSNGLSKKLNSHNV